MLMIMWDASPTVCASLAECCATLESMSVLTLLSRNEKCCAHEMPHQDLDQNKVSCFPRPTPPAKNNCRSMSAPWPLRSLLFLFFLSVRQSTILSIASSSSCSSNTSCRTWRPRRIAHRRLPCARMCIVTSALTMEEGCFGTSVRQTNCTTVSWVDTTLHASCT
jgi:hypothetical protein